MVIVLDLQRAPVAAVVEVALESARHAAERIDDGVPAADAFARDVVQEVAWRVSPIPEHERVFVHHKLLLKVDWALASAPFGRKPTMTPGGRDQRSSSTSPSMSGQPFQCAGNGSPFG